MNNFNRTAVFVTSVLLLFSVFVVSGGVQPNPVEGAPPVYTLELNVANAPTISSGIPGSGTVSYKNSVTMHYDLVQDTVSAHTTITTGGSIYNDAATSITSITSIMATFSGSGTLKYGANFHRETVIVDTTMVSEETYTFSDHYEFFEIKAEGGDIVLTSFIITYTCVYLDPQYNYWLYGTYYELQNVTRDPYTVNVPSTYNELPVTALMSGAFNSAASLQSITLNTNLTSIGSSAFGYCPQLASVTLSDTLTTIGDSAFTNTPLLTDIIFPSTLTSIGDSGFSSSGLTHVILPDGFTTLVGWAFMSCASLIDLVIPVSLTTIAAWTFSGCTAFQKTFYRGDSTQWAAMTIDSSNSVIQDHVNFYSETDPSASGYWHYDGMGVPTVWPV